MCILTHITDIYICDNVGLGYFVIILRGIYQIELAYNIYKNYVVLGHLVPSSRVHTRACHN